MRHSGPVATRYLPAVAPSQNFRNYNVWNATKGFVNIF